MPGWSNHPVGEYLELTTNLELTTSSPLRVITAHNHHPETEEASIRSETAASESKTEGLFEIKSF